MLKLTLEKLKEYLAKIDLTSISNQKQFTIIFLDVSIKHAPLIPFPVCLFRILTKAPL